MIMIIVIVIVVIVILLLLLLLLLMIIIVIMIIVITILLLIIMIIPIQSLIVLLLLLIIIMMIIVIIIAGCKGCSRSRPRVSGQDDRDLRQGPSNYMYTVYTCMCVLYVYDDVRVCVCLSVEASALLRQVRFYQRSRCYLCYDL